MGHLSRAFLALVLLFASLARGGEAWRALPESYLPGQSFTVSIDARPGAADWNYAVEDTPPAGWLVEAVNRNGVWDPQTGRVKWGPFPDNSVRTFTYRVTPPDDATGEVQFTGRASFSTGPVAIGGAQVVARQASRVIRELPDAFQPGVAFTARWVVEPRPGAQIQIVEETLPEGWAASDLSHGGAVDLIQRKLKWGPFSDDTRRVLSAELLPPENADSPVVFNGIATFDGETNLIEGPFVLAPHPSIAYRVIPPEFSPGSPLTAQLRVEPAPQIRLHSVEEEIPAGWSFVSASHDGHFDSATRTLKWGPFQDADARALEYVVLPPEDTREPGVFRGEAVFDLTSVIVARPDTTSPAISELTRALPPSFKPGTPFDLGLQASPAAYVRAYAVEETLPPNWTAEAISHGGSFDATTRKVKWGPFPDALPRALTCRVASPEGFVDVAKFEGTGVFDTLVLTASGPDETIATSRLTRELPATFRDGETLRVVLRSEPLEGVSTHAIEETLPEGWEFESATGAGVWHAETRTVRWGPFSDDEPRELELWTTAPDHGLSDVAVFSGRGVYDAQEIITSGPSELPRLANLAPRILDFAAERPPEGSVKFPIAKLLAIGRDMDGGTLELLSVGPSTAAGGQVFITGAWVIYIPPAGWNGTDSFEYTVTDGQGALETATVRIQVVDSTVPRPPNALRVVAQPDGSVRVDFIGIGGLIYLVQGSVDLENWITLDTVEAGPTGLFHYIDTEAPSYPNRYYRSMDP